MQIVADRMLALPKAAPMAAGRHWINQPASPSRTFGPI
jgi:hypothetical protein